MAWFSNMLPSTSGAGEGGGTGLDFFAQKWSQLQEAASEAAQAGAGAFAPADGQAPALSWLASPFAAGQPGSSAGSSPVRQGGPDEVSEIMRADGRPQAKKASGKKARALPAWEVDSDAEDAVASEGERPMTQHSNFFMSKADTEAAEQYEARMRQVQEKDGGGDEGALCLQAFEERALGMKHMTRKSTLAALQEGETPSPPPQENSEEEDEEEDEESSEDELSDPLARNPRDAAKRGGLPLHELHVLGKWNHCTGATWTTRGDIGELSGDHRTMYATYQEVKFSDLDVQADIMILEGDHAGLIFHMNDRGVFQCLCLNVKDQRIELRSPTEAVKLGDHEIKRNQWHQLRVRVAGSSMSFFVDRKMMTFQRTCYQVGDIVHVQQGFEEGRSDEGRINEVNGDGTYMIGPVGLSDARDVKCHERDLRLLPGTVGIWCSRSIANIRSAIVTNLEDFVEDMRRQDRRMIEEEVVNQEREKHNRASMLRRTRAAKLIQEVSKMNLSIMKQRMQMYRQAERQHRDEQMRERKLLTWFALFSIFAKFNEVMARPEKMEKRQKQYLELLDLTDPPPPAPPLKDPPKEIDEMLHYRYEERRVRYADRWEKAGKMVVGQEKFEKILNMENGPAEREKKAIASKCFTKAAEVMSEQEHQEYLQKAWRLENDWVCMDDMAHAQEEIERWREEKTRANLQKEKMQKTRTKVQV